MADGIGRLTLGKLDTTTASIPVEESISGMVFLLSERGSDYMDSFPLAQLNFADGNPVLINNLGEAEAMGITEGGILAGVPHYHIQHFYETLGKEYPLYVAFTDTFDETYLSQFQKGTKNQVSQIGLWSEKQPIHLKRMAPGSHTQYSLAITIPFGSDIENFNKGTSFPVSVLYCSNTAHWGKGKLDYRSFPTISNIGYPGLSLLIGQNGGSEELAMQENTVNNTPVGMLGFVLAFLTLAPAQESITYVKNYNLNANDSFSVPQIGGVSLDDINDTQLSLLAAKGYIFPIKRKNREGGVYLSTESTMSDGDYSTISMNRLIHKNRRITYSVLVRHIGNSFEVDPETGDMPGSVMSPLLSELYSASDRLFVDKRGHTQVDGRLYYLNTHQGDIHSTDSITLHSRITPINGADDINVEETYEIQTSE